MASDITLAQLIFPWIKLSNTIFSDLPIQRLELDSRKIIQGDTFIALIGYVFDARRFIGHAISSGANIVLAQSCSQYAHGRIEYIADVPIIYIKNLNMHLSELAGRFYQNNSNTLIGVTGTNGKTTISQIIVQWLELLGKRAAVMGTIGNGFLDNLKKTANTTGNALEIQHILSDLEQQGAEYTALELSSHGLQEGRVGALKFSAGIFSNLSRDHLDYHANMREYAEAKFSLFSKHSCQQIIINADDKIGSSWLKRLPNALAVCLSTSPTTSSSVFTQLVEYSNSGIKISFSGKYGKGVLSAPFIGAFNASNLLLAFSCLLALGFDKKKLIESSSKLVPVIGRMELFQASGKAKVVVDYAHTPDALKKALIALRTHCSGHLWVILGCGGERDRGKRPIMAAIVEKRADKIVLTDDNPRGESPQLIIEDMLKGLKYPLLAYVEHHRYEAIRFALSQAKGKDIILLAGKGHEDYQVMANERIHYSDRESVRQLLGIN
ncbi:UDP-N-acetylmuramoyl-L-alanyl-D-glutamate--2,6-diaminopimelate ligase [Candidatus Photodesmus blepharus]|uniref:UDP-N-acetylmuramoyl-L-alanyl-D-glutamate--2,6-diaminopimelate ligase n=1 Tax=Candidatus Photodesmus blepharonis TaxID=1179155 RepID=A0A084CMU3_9GAMM|nr:UDP-N-acetylmuramoyl-L-alanyl-D-glutamate--2,6-diaminopimelate ligase [Candidatus Photodesmus blepharus]KEY91122.1 UDP-N-acetylmuramoyl-L-alanyl-D-glutamate--2,6-diaminopimelate ligase [Candidatus Photodesmus blepharus]